MGNQEKSEAPAPTINIHRKTLGVGWPCPRAKFARFKCSTVSLDAQVRRDDRFFAWASPMCHSRTAVRARHKHAPSTGPPSPLSAVRSPQSAVHTLSSAPESWG
ncbi:hypothetical protein PDE_09795 [Penicillium oxalicum 114-2]|uniref:Uncharacterized protein n=1 Tax=Penicillium oxalicum (strain 114-2 / CGMCC 5302) TaxID=933388 RepID=S8A144_PENO1|nr:hypothetical protein PDE_09795 [Penicillium oxalicum 114-2]